MKTYLISSLLLLCLLSISHNSSAQNTSINIEAETSVNGNEFIIDIYKTATAIKIIYHLRDSLRYKAMEKSPEYVAASKNFLDEWAKKPLNKDSLNLAADKLEQVTHQYGVYSNDSLKLNPRTYNAYAKLLDSVNTTSSEVLANEDYNKTRIVLDGTQFEFTIKSGNSSRGVHAHSPDATSNPLLYNLLKQTLAIYRQIKPGTFLTPKRTSGY